MAADPLDALQLPVVPVDPRPEFAAALLRRITAAEDTAAEDTPADGGRSQAAAPSAAGSGGSPTVRYFVHDLDVAVAFYRQRLGFEEELRSAPGFAMLSGGGLRLLLSVSGLPGAGRPLARCRPAAAGGSNRIALQVPDLTAAVRELREAGVRIRAGVSQGVAVRQALIEDPSGNLVELYEPAAGYHERS